MVIHQKTDEHNTTFSARFSPLVAWLAGISTNEWQKSPLRSTLSP
jgi:hypothetical protein